MESLISEAPSFFRQYHPFDGLTEAGLEQLIKSLSVHELNASEVIYSAGDEVTALRTVARGTVELLSAEGEVVSEAHVGDTFGARALFYDGVARQTARAKANGTDVALYEVGSDTFRLLAENEAALRAFYRPYIGGEAQSESGADASLVGVPIAHLMTRDPVSVAENTSIREAAAIMGEGHISCVLVVREEQLVGLLTTGDITARVVAEGFDRDAPVKMVMTENPISFSPTDSGFDAMLAMSSSGIGHLPIVEDGKPVGIVTRTNLVRRQQVSAIYMIGDIKRLSDAQELARVIDQVPALLAQLVGSGVAPHEVGHVVTSITDALTERLLTLGEEKLGPAPIPYLWLACGSQGRREQTGVSDQDNCLILHDDFLPEEHDPYFKELAQFVSDGLDEAGYFYCPGDMMATNPQWRQPVSVWRGYFEKWVSKPDPMAQMLASVMFDLRAIAGEVSLFEGLQARTLELAKANSIFRAHMVANSLKHTPPLGVFRGFALIRSGEHKDTLDLKHNGVVPVVDLARVYALEGAVEQVNTRARLVASQEAGTVSKEGGRDLIDAFDLISTVRLRHQARQIRDGDKPDNFLPPSRLSAFERNHLKDAFGVIKGLQSALSHGRSAG
ncbi:MAG: DUF294 nucleotidyltransferase-like domain-containing protein [Pseudomonadota bacterium]